MNKLLTVIRGHSNKRIFFALVALIAVGGVVAFQLAPQPKTEITTKAIPDTANKGRIISGQNTSDDGLLTTRDTVTFESRPVETQSKTANAVTISWKVLPLANGTDEQDAGTVALHVRTAHKGKWSPWVNASADSDDRKDGTQQPTLHKAIVLADVVEEMQYRLVLDAGKVAAPVVDINKTEVQVIDASRGPSLQKKSLLEKVIGRVLSGDQATAKADGPRIYQREEWGGWENPSIGWHPNSSPEWPEQYEALHQIIVHHTASTVNGDSFAAMRALWQFHANGNAWGDIGYNYVVDPWGNIFKGRHYVEADSKQQKGEVVAGHAYEHNRGTSGISVLGDYTNSSPTPEAMYSVARIAAYKAMPYRFNPADLSNLVGHRDVTSTGCPGQTFYNLLPEIRKLTNVYYSYYVNMDNFDASYRGQQSYAAMWPNTEAPAYLDVKNEGVEPWLSSGPSAVMLAADRPKGRMSPVCSDWANCAVIGSFNQKVTSNESGPVSVEAADTIQPGETARFNFTMRSPGVGGNYREYYSLVRNNGWLARDLNIYYDLTVPHPTYQWKMTQQDVYSDVARTQRVNPNALSMNTTYYARVKAYNAGNQSWYRDGQNPVRYATNTPSDRPSAFCEASWLGTDCNRPAGLLEARTDPMTEGTFDFKIKTPAVPGQYREHFNLMVERKFPMTGENQYWDFKVLP